MSSFPSSCGACKFLRRKCDNGCVYAPYFCDDQSANHFSAVHKVFGARNVSKLLLNLPPHKRFEAAATITYEALARMRDPVYGCVAHVFALQQQVAQLQEEIDYLESQFAGHAVNFDIHQDSRVWNNTNCGFQLLSELDLFNVPYYCSQKASDASRCLDLSNEKSQQHPPDESRDGAFCFDATHELSSSDELYVEMDQAAFLCDPVLDYTK